MRKFIYTLIVFLFSASLVAQNISVKGKVSDDSGEPIIGANIKLQDGKTIGITDIDGLFSVNIPSKPGLVLTVSYMGYKSQNVKLTGNTELNIVMKGDAQKLDEIVVIGYGTQKRSSLTSSIETINSEDLLRIPTTNIDQALAGQAAGLGVLVQTGDPSSGKEANISIRGIPKDPLLVIDGVPRSGTDLNHSETRLSDLNPDDIESISVLKDAGAAAVYGVRGAYGVVLVTTKRGKGDKKTRMNYRGQFNLQQATKFPDFLGAYEFAKLLNKAYDNSGRTDERPYSGEDLEIIRTQSDLNRFGDTNLLDYLKDYGYSTTHSLSVTGGNQDITYYVSGGYTKNQGLYGGVGRDRYNYSMKLDANLMKGLTLSVDMMGTRSEYQNTSYATLEAAYSFRPTQILEYTDGRLASINGSNPLIAVRGLGGYTKNKGNLNTLSANLKYDFLFLKGLSVYLKTTFDTNNSVVKILKKPTTLYMKDPDNPGETIADPNTTYPKAKIPLSEADLNIDNRLLEAGINYNNTFAAKHNVTGMLVTNYQETNYRSFGGINENMPGVPPENVGSGVLGKLNGTESYLERASLIGRFSYAYDYKYFFEVNFRFDESTKFHPDYRLGFFPSASASWILSNEQFFKSWKQDAISNIKFRGSVGLLGYDGDNANYSYLMRYVYANGDGYPIGGNLRPGIIMSIDDLPNPELEWGKRKDYNIATDLGFWDNRFGITYEYFWRYETDEAKQLPSYLYPPSAGAGGRTPYVNFGELKAWGWDLTFSHKNAINKVKYNVDLVLSRAKDKWLDYGDESNNPNVNTHKKGKGRFMMLVYEADGLFQDQEEIDNLGYDQDGSGNSTLAPGDIKYKNQNGDGVINSEDLIAVKSSNYPDLTIGLKLGIDYKGFFMNAMFHGVSGYHKYINDIYTLESNSVQRFQQYHLNDTWSEDNRGATYPRVKIATSGDNNRKASTLWIKECDFLRLKTLTIGYSMPSRIVKRLKLNTLNFSLQGSNLFTISTLKDMDPESQRGYPIQRSYGASISVGF